MRDMSSPELRIPQEYKIGGSISSAPDIVAQMMRRILCFQISSA